jgi:hypothetical protein
MKYSYLSRDMCSCIEQHCGELEVDGWISHPGNTGCEDVKWPEVTQDKIEYWSLVNTVMNIKAHKAHIS